MFCNNSEEVKSPSEQNGGDFYTAGVALSSVVSLVHHNLEGGGKIGTVVRIGMAQIKLGCGRTHKDPAAASKVQCTWPRA